MKHPRVRSFAIAPLLELADLVEQWQVAEDAWARASLAFDLHYATKSMAKRKKVVADREAALLQIMLLDKKLRDWRR